MNGLSWIDILLALAITVAAAVVLAILIAVPVHIAARRKDWARSLLRYATMPFRVLLLVLCLTVTAAIMLPDDEWWANAIQHGFIILVIAATAWFVGALVVFLENLALVRYQARDPDSRRARRVRTQVLILRRVTIAAVVVLAIGAILMTYPEVRAVGASVLASAGILSIIGGLAAQSSLANIFAGLQLAFTDAIRVDDVVVVESQWGRIEDITLTYVVVRIWDDRRLVLPSTYFTTKPFENWTHSGTELTGSVELDLDWQVSPDRMRERLAEVLDGSELWDRRVSRLQITDAVRGAVHVRILVSAADSSALWTLRCEVREAMITWLQEHDPRAFPRTRVALGRPGESVAESNGGS